MKERIVEMRYRFRKPFKMTPEALRLMRFARRQGATYSMCADFAGVGKTAAFLWLTGKRPMRGAT